MVRFIIFGGEHYYPKGGANDILGTRTIGEEAIEFAKGLLGKEVTQITRADSVQDLTIAWVQVLDTKTGIVIFKEGEPFGYNDPFALVDTNVGKAPVNFRSYEEYEKWREDE